MNDRYFAKSQKVSKGVFLIIFIVLALGYIDTNLSFGKKLILPKGSTQKLSKLVYKNKNKKLKKYFFPNWWVPIIFFLKILPLSFLVNFNIFKK